MVHDPVEQGDDKYNSSSIHLQFLSYLRKFQAGAAPAQSWFYSMLTN